MMRKDNTPGEGSQAMDGLSHLLRQSVQSIDCYMDSFILTSLNEAE